MRCFPDVGSQPWICAETSFTARSFFIVFGYGFLNCKLFSILENPTMVNTQFKKTLAHSIQGKEALPPPSLARRAFIYRRLAPYPFFQFTHIDLSDVSPAPFANQQLDFFRFHFSLHFVMRRLAGFIGTYLCRLLILVHALFRASIFKKFFLEF